MPTDTRVSWPTASHMFPLNECIAVDVRSQIFHTLRYTLWMQENTRANVEIPLKFQSSLSSGQGVSSPSSSTQFHPAVN